jgi:hypothetical protein
VPPTPTPFAEDPSLATRVTIPSLRIDLPVISPEVHVPGQGPDGYPPCDVALFHQAFGQPGELGTTYLYAHARDGMFLPLLTSSEDHDGRGMLGAIVEIYTDDDLRYIYTISEVKRHAIDFSIATASPGSQQVVLQTSEGPRGTVPKLQVLATLQAVLPADDASAHPPAQPRGCYDTP